MARSAGERAKAFGVIRSSAHPQDDESVIRRAAKRIGFDLTDVFIPNVQTSDLAIWLLERVERYDVDAIVLARLEDLDAATRDAILKRCALITPVRILPCSAARGRNG
jgi:hypothetical protein